ncbi:MAG: histidine kinase [Betaproteobacteria bacterium]|nr:histidine kinase [Betaproteobacteria bacterium]
MSASPPSAAAIAAASGPPATRLAVPAAHVGLAVLAGAAWGLANTTGWWLAHGGNAPARMAAHFVAEATLPLLLLAVLLAVADRATRAHPHRAGPYAAAAVGAAVGGELLFRMLGPLLGLGACHCTMDQWPVVSRVANMLPDSLIICGFVTIGYRYRRRAGERVARVRAAELERARLTREAQASRLQAMQACIEPQFLFDTLADALRLHGTEPVTATRLLDHLIVYLRAALPHLKQTTSTVARECELAGAYLDILRTRGGGRPAFDVAVDAAVRDARLPPMLLLPLLGYAAAATGHDGAPAEAVEMRAAADGPRLAITLTVAGPARAPAGDAGDAVASVQQRLRALYGTAAKLATGVTATGALRITMELPDEGADGDRR